MIEVKGMTLRYKNGKGVFDLDFNVAEGEIMGYLGPNGAGKTTTIRGLMGFMRPNSGRCTINGRDCFLRAAEIHKDLGYIPGEINFIENMESGEYLRLINDIRGTNDKSRQKQLMDRLEFCPKGSIKKFSKGMKQKLGIISAFMHDPKVLILDEPTSGLDPLMQNRFVELLQEEKRRGKTILMSSHAFSEIEKTCDNVLIIKDGRIIANSDIATLKKTQRKCFIIKTNDNKNAAEAFKKSGCSVLEIADGSLEVHITGDETDRLLKSAAGFTVLSLDIKAQTLEDIFMHFYYKEAK